MVDEAENNNDALKMLRHDINNQLSSIQLCLEHLKYEVEDQTEDYVFYLETIADSCRKITVLLKNPER